MEVKLFINEKNRKCQHININPKWECISTDTIDGFSEAQKYHITKIPTAIVIENEDIQEVITDVDKINKIGY